MNESCNSCQALFFFGVCLCRVVCVCVCTEVEINFEYCSSSTIYLIISDRLSHLTWISSSRLVWLVGEHQGHTLFLSPQCWAYVMGQHTRLLYVASETPIYVLLLVQQTLY